MRASVEREVVAHLAAGGLNACRYLFTQVSTDIKGIFSDARDRLGIAYRHSNWKTVSIARAGSVALLDSFVGPKA